MEGNNEFAIITDELFVGLTRPATLLGVPYKGVIIELMVASFAFLAAGNPLYMLTVIPIHSALFILSKDDPGIFDTIFIWASTAGRCVTRNFWGATSFSPLDYSQLRKK
ncbi:type IV secretion system protein VirB3 [Metapseudomonas otitidis]|uniref:type IV secretion system protein VirB3 n=1 Tax=Metapseudomonas otitidis TaxID=319939 RepID=UPI000D1A093D|nr:type IV secretion system protein VirB3 [Pseudomonas otitidis]